ncbi:hypothetical protein FACS1894167_14540 [Synergistales bacterium]|nr:hypothetical protein FACS1894167_14540 [Synergistales bacterium]
MLWLTSCPILKISKPPYIDISVLIILKLKHYNSNAAERRNFIRSYVKSVIVHEDKIEVKFKIHKPDEE